MTKGFLFKSYLYIYEHYTIYELPWDSTITWIIAALSYDCGYYWFHRAAHGNNINAVMKNKIQCFLVFLFLEVIEVKFLRNILYFFQKLTYFGQRTRFTTAQKITTFQQQ